MASTPSIPQQEANSPKLKAILEMAQKDMPLPVLEVVAWPLSERKLKVAIQMSTAGFAWAKKPVMNVMFQTSDESVEDQEQALHKASAVAKEFIEAAKNERALKEAR
jgi:hypothetical protein